MEPPMHIQPDVFDPKSDPLQEPACVWHQYPHETEDAFEAFATYRDAAIRDRSLAKVARKLGKSTDLLERWSSANAWRKRVFQYDNEQDRIRLAAHDQAITQMSKRHAQAAQLVFVKVVEYLQALDVAALDPKDVVSLFRTCVMVERQARGAETVLKRRLELAPIPVCEHTQANSKGRAHHGVNAARRFSLERRLWPGTKHHQHGLLVAEPAQKRARSHIVLHRQPSNGRNRAVRDAKRAGKQCLGPQPGDHRPGRLGDFAAGHPDRAGHPAADAAVLPAHRRQRL
jgi:hypothetical protein